MDPVEPWIDGNAVRRLAAQLLSSPRDPEIADSPDAGFGPGFEGFTSGDTASEAGPAESSMPASPLSSPASPVPARVIEVIHEEVGQVVPEVTPEVIFEVASEEEPQVAEKAELSTFLRADRAEAKPFLAAAEKRPLPEDLADHGFRQTSESEENRYRESRRGPLMERMVRFRNWLINHADARSVFVLDREGQPVLDDPAYVKLHFLARSLSQAYRPVPGQPGNVHVKVGSDAYLVVIPVETAFGCLVLGAVLPRPLDASSVELVAKALADSAKPGGVD